ncbi:MAG: hypothetical protein IH840_05200 [Candidatus Heimdallarchaeota archaeon]|nr:hypothetical protein [Candidatus Heimdallarchaeota archaeon]
MSELTFPLERSPAMKILGNLWTGKISGQILVLVLLAIGVAFLGNQGFNFLSIFFVLGFILPTAYWIHKRVVTKGKRLMGGWCDVKVQKNTLSYKTGFPNTMNPEWQELTLTKKNRNIIIRGGEVGGYHLRIGGTDKNPLRLGLWVNLENAREGGQQLADLLGGKVSEKLFKDDPDEKMKTN